jgi:hypothetical protein
MKALNKNKESENVLSEFIFDYSSAEISSCASPAMVLLISRLNTLEVIFEFCASLDFSFIFVSTQSPPVRSH